MKKIATTFLILTALSSCGDVEGSNPFIKNGQANTETDADGNIIVDERYNANFIDSDTTVSAKNSANREDGTTQFRFTNVGELKNVRFARVPDRNDDLYEVLLIDNIPFDGTATLPYAHESTGQSATGVQPVQAGFRLFDAQDTVTDDVSGATIDQLNYYALYGQSRSGATEFVIVKTDSYIGEGFGGHIVQRNSFDFNDDAVIFSRPEASQARLDGQYDGFIVSTTGDNEAPLTQTRADVTLLVDFDDFNDKPAVIFFATNREAVTKVRQEIGYNIVFSERITQLQNISTKVGSGAIDSVGKFDIAVFSTDQSENGTIEGYLAGQIPTEAAGILRLTGENYIETGGFFAYRE